MLHFGLECGKHVEIINHSIYPQDNLSIDDRNIINLYKLVYDAIDFAAIREPLSYNLARKIGIRAIESFDCSPIYIKNHYTPDRKKDPKTLLIAGSANWLHLNILSDEKGNIDEFKNGLSQFSSYLNAMHRQGYSITFLYGAKDWPAKDDREFVAFVKPRLKFDLKIFEAKNIDQWLSCIENAELLVSGRFHHTIAAGCLGTRFIALNSNTPKMDGLLKALGTERALRYDDPDLAEKLHKQTLESYNKPIDHILGQKLCDKAMLNFHCLHNAENFQ